MLTSGDGTAQNPTSLHVPDVFGMDTLTAALAYAAAGWYIAPTNPAHENPRERKNPGVVLGRGWDEKTSRDPQQIAGWYAGTDYGIALHAGRSGAVIFDVDEPAPGPELDALIAELDATGAPYQRTDKAGRRLHYVVRQPAGFDAGNGAKNVGVRKVDVRGKNGVIVVYPTPRPGEDDREYMWLRVGPVPAPTPALTARMAPAVQAATRLEDGARLAFMDRLAGGPMCDRVLAICGTANWTGGRYEEAMRLTLSLLHAGREGHTGVREAVDLLASVYREQIGTERRDPTEWQRQLAGAVDQAAEHGAIVPVDPCHPPAAFAPPVNAAWEVPPTRAAAALVAMAPAVVAPSSTRVDFVGRLLAVDDPLERREMSRAMALELVDVPPLDLEAWADDLKQYGGLTRAALDKIRKGVRDERKTLEAARREAERLEEIERRGEQIMPGPHAPLDAARYLAGRIEHTDGYAHVRWWRGDFYRWLGTSWEIWHPEAVENWLYGETGSAAYLDDEGEVIEWRPDSVRVSKIGHALGRSVLYRDSYAEAEDSPALIAARNGALVDGQLLEHHPARFNLFSLPFGYDPHAQCTAWLAFLESVLPGDREAHLFLQEWFGYVVSGRTDLQKMASLYGPKRCGKGTIARVLEALIGTNVVASPTLEKLATQFGEANLVGKRLAVLSDVRWNARATAEAVPSLLAITGEDSRDVARKNRDDWHGKLAVRFMAMGNDAPTFNDASGALASRMIHVRFRTSFSGREDLSLTGRLLEELPGILNWALEGLATLTARGRFAPPASSKATDEMVQRMSSPVGAFLMDCTTQVMSGEVSVHDLFKAYQAWSLAEEGRSQTPAQTRFANLLESALDVAYPGKAIEVSTGRKWDATRSRQSRYVIGLALNAQPVLSAQPAPAGWVIGPPA